MDINNEMPVKPSQLMKTGLIVAGVIVVGVIITGLVLVARQASKGPADDAVFDNSSFTSEAVIQITSAGFVPESLTVSPHTKVSFVNKDGVSHVVSLNDTAQQDIATDSDNDPQLPDNDPVLVGGGLGHVFEKRATYIYHDQAVPTKNVSIIVK